VRLVSAGAGRPARGAARAALVGLLLAAAGCAPRSEPVTAPSATAAPASAARPLTKAEALDLLQAGDAPVVEVPAGSATAAASPPTPEASPPGASAVGDDGRPLISGGDPQATVIGDEVLVSGQAANRTDTALRGNLVVELLHDGALLASHTVAVAQLDAHGFQPYAVRFHPAQIDEHGAAYSARVRLDLHPGP
jgi:hypothetical protein